MTMTDHSPKREYASKTDQLFYEQIIRKAEPEFIAAADRLGISNEELQQAVIDYPGSAFAEFCRRAITHRRGCQLVAMRIPGEECVSLAELAERESRRKGQA